LTARPAAAGAVLALALLTASWAAAQAPPAASTAPPIVDEVRAEREGRAVTTPAITSLIETSVGRPLLMREVRETIAHLVNLNLYDDVRVLSEPSGGGGVRLIYRLVPIHAVDRVEFRGMLGLPEGDLRRAVDAGFGEIPRAAQAESVAALLRTLYREHGYPMATVSGEVVETHEPDRATLVMNVQSGPRPPVVDVQLTRRGWSTSVRRCGPGCPTTRPPWIASSSGGPTGCAAAATTRLVPATACCSRPMARC